MTASASRTLLASDPILVEVVGSALASIAEEMGETLVRTSFSPNIKERRDCSCAIFDADGVSLCQASHTPIHLGSFLEFIPYILSHYDGDDIRPGDVFFGNDPFIGGSTHLNDVVFAEPIFVDGQLVCWAINTAHHTDFADRGHDHIFQEGIRLPPVKIYEAGQLVQSIQDIFLLNCQVPQERLSDLRAQMAANALCRTRIEALCRKHGTQLVLTVGRALQDYSEARMRTGIAELPDGTYRFADKFDFPDLPELLDLSIEITVSGSDIACRFEGPDQVRGSTNVNYTALCASVIYALKTIIDPDAPPNGGLARPITIVAREGSILNCRSPAAVNGRLCLCQRIVDLIYGALAQIVPKQLTAAASSACTAAQFVGYRPETSSAWIYGESVGGGGGARYNKDGLDGIHVHLTNTSNLPIEAMEREYPVTIRRYELVDDSCGAGQFRGGMGIRRLYRLEEDCRGYLIEATRQTTAPWGLAGGLEGGRGHHRFTNTPPYPESQQMRAGDTVELVTPGGAGFGPPEARDPDLVRQDLREERISPETAANVYLLSSNERSSK